MEAKVFEVRDRGTFIPMLAVKLRPANEAERYMTARMGYGIAPMEQATYVLMTPLGGGDVIEFDPAAWGGRTRPVAHQYIIDNFDTLEPGAVVDVRFILGETDAPAPSEASYETA